VAFCRDNYMAILMQKWVQVFSDIFDKDDYTGVPAPDEEHYYFVVKTFPYVDEQFEKVRDDRWKKGGGLRGGAGAQREEGGRRAAEA